MPRAGFAESQVSFTGTPKSSMTVIDGGLGKSERPSGNEPPELRLVRDED